MLNNNFSTFIRQPLPSVSTKLGLHHCTWCVQNARCHHKEGKNIYLFKLIIYVFAIYFICILFLDNYGVCGEETPSQSPGWWGASGTEISHPSECSILDKRPGFTFIKYQHPVILSYPDQVIIINATTVDFNTPGSSNRDHMSGEMVAQLKGFLHTPTNWADIGEMLRVCVGYSRAELNLTRHDYSEIINISAFETSSLCRVVNGSLEPGKIAIDFRAYRIISPTSHNSHQQSKMEIQHNKSSETSKVFMNSQKYMNLKIFTYLT